MFRYAENLARGSNMSDDDTQEEPAPTAKPAPIAVLYRALTDVQIECALLTTAIRHQDCESARIAAEDAVSSCLVAMTALRRLEPRPNDDEEVHGARLALKEARTMLDDVFQRALAKIASAPLHQLLQQLVLSLSFADGCHSTHSQTSL
jgi:hypothetical protein